MSDKKRYEVQIGNSSYIIRSARTKEETDSIVDYVNTEIEAAKKSIKYNNPSMVATLACLNIADNLFTIKEDFNKVTSQEDTDHELLENFQEKYQQTLYQLASMEEELQSLRNKQREEDEKYLALEEEKERYRLELNKRMRDFEKSGQELQDLRDKLIAQEAETLKVYKQLQEAIKNSGK